MGGGDPSPKKSRHLSGVRHTYQIAEYGPEDGQFLLLRKSLGGKESDLTVYAFMDSLAQSCKA